MLIKNYFLLLFSCFSFVLSAQNDSTSRKPDQIWNTLEKPQFSIDYPEGWVLDSSGLMGTTLLIFSPVTGPEDQFRENVNLMIQDLSNYQLTLDQFVELSEQQIKTIITDGKILSSDRLEKEGRPYQRALYTGKQGILDLKFEQYYWVENNTAYILTFTTEIDQFDTYQETGEKILNSYRMR